MYYRTSALNDFGRMFNNLDRVSRAFFAPQRQPSAGPVEEDLEKRTPFLGSRYPSVDAFQRDDQIVVRAELPGVNRDEVDVTVEDGRLILRGEKKTETEQNEETFHVREVRYGRFERAFVLPEGVTADVVKARLENGVLEVTIPMPRKAESRKIEIEAGDGPSDESKAA